MDNTKPVNLDLQISSKLNNLTAYDVGKRDVFGRTLLHIICTLGRDDLLLKVLRKNFSGNNQTTSSKRRLQSLSFNINILDYENGYNCLHYAIYYGNVACINVLLRADLINEKSRNELLNTKDRENFTPIDLLNHLCDFRHFKIIPESIGFRNQNIEVQNDRNFINFNYIARFTNVDNNSKSQYNSQFFWNKIRGAPKLYTFGSNINNNLGLSNSSKVDKPVQVNFFSQNSTFFSSSSNISQIAFRIKDIKVSRYHTVLLLTNDTKNILICGNGKYGRLGLNNNDTIPRAEFVPVSSLITHIEKVAVSDDHTLALDSHNQLFSWGSNAMGQLGYATNLFSSNSKPLKIALNSNGKDQIHGIACAKHYSLCYSKDTIHYWGLNVGQFGFQTVGEVMHYKNLKGNIQIIPFAFSFLYAPIKQVVTLENATLVLTDNSNNEIHVYMNYFHAKIQPPLFFQQFRNMTFNTDTRFDKFEFKALSSRRTIVKIVGKSSTVGLLYDNGYILTLKIDSKRSLSPTNLSIDYSVAWAPKKSGMRSLDFDISDNGSIIITTVEGLVFQRRAQDTNNSTTLDKQGKSKGGLFLRKNNFKTTQLPGFTKAVKVACDSDFTSFGFLVDSVDLLPLKLLKSNFFNDLLLLSPLSNSLKSIACMKMTEKQLFMVSDLLENPVILKDINSLLKRKKINLIEKKSQLYYRDDIDNEDDGDEESDENDVVNVVDDLDDMLDSQNRTLSRYKLIVDKASSDLLYIRYLKKWHKLLPETLNRSSYEKSIYSNNDNSGAYISKLTKASIDGPFTQSPFSENHWQLQLLSNSHSFIIGVIPEILIARCLIFENLFFLSDNNCITTKQNGMQLCVELSKEQKCLTLTTLNIEITPKVIEIILHFIYTDENLMDGANIKLQPEIIKQIKQVAQLLNIYDSFQTLRSSRSIMDSMNYIIENNSLFANISDTVIQCKDCELLYCSSEILSARCIYFKNCFSDRNNWLESIFGINSSRLVKFEDISRSHMLIIVKYIYGFNPLTLLSQEFFHHLKTITNENSIINFCLGLCDICNLLLLVNLKDYIEYFICGFINIENIYEISSIALELNCQNLFEQCCWFIFNNAYEVLFLSDKKLEQNVCFKLNRYFKYFYLFRHWENIYRDSETGTVLITIDNNINSYKVRNTNDLIYDFLFDLSKHNKYYMLKNTSFKIVVDYRDPNMKAKIAEKEEMKITRGASLSFDDNLRRLSSTTDESRLSFKNEFPDIKEMNFKGILAESAIIDGEDDEQQYLDKTLVNASVNLVNQTYEEDFIPVTSSRRRKSSRTRLSIDMNNSFLPMISSSNSASSSRRASFTNSATNILASVSSKPDSSSLSRSTGLLSHAADSSIWPALEEKEKSTKANNQPSVNTSFNSGLGTSFKISQKDKLKLPNHVIFSTTRQIPSNLNAGDEIFKAQIAKHENLKLNRWLRSSNELGISANSAKSLSKSPDEKKSSVSPLIKNDENFPILNWIESEKKNKQIQKSNNIDISEIMVEEKMKKENIVEYKIPLETVKSLDDIQREEEFMKWFEEESKRVQKAMKSNHSQNIPARNDFKASEKRRSPENQKPASSYKGKGKSKTLYNSHTEDKSSKIKPSSLKKLDNEKENVKKHRNLSAITNGDVSKNISKQENILKSSKKLKALNKNKNKNVTNSSVKDTNKPGHDNSSSRQLERGSYVPANSTIV